MRPTLWIFKKGVQVFRRPRAIQSSKCARVSSEPIDRGNVTTNDAIKVGACSILTVDNLVASATLSEYSFATCDIRRGQNFGKRHFFLGNRCFTFTCVNNVGLLIAMSAYVVHLFCHPLAQKQDQKCTTKRSCHLGEGHCIEHTGITSITVDLRRYLLLPLCSGKVYEPRPIALPGAVKGLFMVKRIAFQGELGAYSHEAVLKARPGAEPLPCATFEDAIASVTSGHADLAMLPVENTTYGRVADIHRLLPESGLHIIDEAFVRVRIALMALPGQTLSDIKKVRAHIVLIPQARAFLDANGIRAEAAADSAGAAADLVKRQAMGEGALASVVAADIHGLNVLARDIEDAQHNTTRFLLMSPDKDLTRRSEHMMTTFVFEVRNIPAALYKAMGGFATNGVNMTKLESYMVGGAFTATQFYADIAGHPQDPPVKRAMEELAYFTSRLEILGVYPAATARD